MKNIVLTGFMASGKTTIGKELEKITGKRLLDTDLVIEEESGMTTQEIIEKFGIDKLRELESIAVLMCAAESGVIISTGGGAVIKDENREVLKKTGVVFNLVMDEELIKERLPEAKKTRPLMQDSEENIIKLFREREKFYADCDFKVYTKGKLPEEIAAEILKNYILKTMILKEGN